MSSYCNRDNDVMIMMTIMKLILVIYSICDNIIILTC